MMHTIYHLNSWTRVHICPQSNHLILHLPTYEPGPGELLIKVESVGLAPCDWAIQALGIIVEKYPVIVGEDIAGTVEEVGNGVTKFKKGDRVYVYCYMVRSSMCLFMTCATLQSFTRMV